MVVVVVATRDAPLLAGAATAALAAFLATVFSALAVALAAVAAPLQVALLAFPALAQS